MKKKYLLVLILLFIFSFYSAVHSEITSPKEQFGHDIGDDYILVNYSQLLEYWKKLEQESERMKLVKIGTTAEGRPMVMAIITSPENHKKLDMYKDISKKLALAEGLTDQEAKEMASRGKAVVWIDGGLHATEVSGAQQEIELVYQMVSQNDPETLRILEDVILLTLITNPDGMEMVGNWYMRNPDPEKRSTRGLPRLYHKYVGHDNNRDFYMVNMPETEAINLILYREWYPQIVYNHHQTGPAGAVLFAPPFREPYNYNYDPLIPLGIDVVGSAMHSRFVAEGKPGSTMREGAWYQTWWNGCLRCTPYFHNMIGILTEMIGNPTPVEIPFLPDKQLPNGDYPFPVEPQKWHFKKTIEYSITADRAVLDIASKLKEDFLFNIYRMGKNSILRGSRDHWTMHPDVVEAVKTQLEKDKVEPTGSRWWQGYPREYFELFRKPDLRDPRGFIIPSDQDDFLTAIKFINILIKNGISVLKSTGDFEIKGKKYTGGSYIVKTAQAFRPHIMDMFEPQDYPDDIPCPGGLPRAPYDSAGYTLAFQMGVEFDRILDGFDGPFERVNGLAEVPAGNPLESDASGYLLSHSVNDSFIAINRLLKSKEKVYWLEKSYELPEKSFVPGAIYIPAGKKTAAKLKKMAQNKGLDFYAVDSPLKSEAFHIKPVRIGLWDRYGGSMASGWIRWLLEQFEFNYELVFPKTLDKGNLINKYDILIFPGGAIPDLKPEDSSSRYRYRQPDPETIPEKYRKWLGRTTVEKTIPQLYQFISNGGMILTIGSSTRLGYHYNLPIANYLAEKTPEGELQPYSRKKYFVPGSILQVRVNNSKPLAYGLPERLDVYFNRSPVFDLLPEASLEHIKPIAWFDSKTPLRSGWAWGQHFLKDGVTVVEAKIGEGTLILFGPEITFRAQPHGTFKFLFNGICLSNAEKITLE